MTKLDKNDFMRDGLGRIVPKSMIRPIDMLRDNVVNELYAKAVSVSDYIRRFNAEARNDISLFLDMAAKDYETELGGGKGNLTLTSYDGKTMLKVQMRDCIVFDEGLQAAKNMIDECIQSWDADDRIRAIVNQAFSVDREGKIYVSRLLGLRKLAIDDPKWLAAMKALAEAVKIVGSKQYIRFYRRESPDKKWEPVPLDMASF